MKFTTSAKVKSNKFLPRTPGVMRTTANHAAVKLKQTFESPENRVDLETIS